MRLILFFNIYTWNKNATSRQNSIQNELKGNTDKEVESKCAIDNTHETKQQKQQKTIRNWMQ